MPIKDATSLENGFEGIRAKSRDVLLHAGTSKMNSDIADLQTEMLTVGSTYLSLSSEVSDSDAAAQLSTFKENFDKYSSSTNDFISLAEKQDTQGAMDKLDANEESAANASAAIIALDDRLDVLARNSEAASTNTESSSLPIFGGIALAAVLVSAFLGILIASAISKPLKKLVKAADRLSSGDTDVKIEVAGRDETGMLAKAFQSMISSIGLLVSDTNALMESAQAGKFDVRADESRHLGDYLKIVQGINRTLDVVVDKVVWYEALLDAVPLPLFATDLDMNWTFINRAVEEFLGVKRGEALGRACSNWNAEICNTETCSHRPPEGRLRADALRGQGQEPAGQCELRAGRQGREGRLHGGRAGRHRPHAHQFLPARRGQEALRRAGRAGAGQPEPRVRRGRGRRIYFLRAR